VTEGANIERQLAETGILRWFGQIVDGLSALGTLWIICVMLLILTDVLGRAVFDAPLVGVPELVTFSIVGISFLQLPRTLRAGGLTRTDILLGYLRRNHPTVFHFWNALLNAVGAAIFTMVAYKLTAPALDAIMQPERHFLGNPGFFVMPAWPLRWVLLVGVTFVALQFTFEALGALRAGTGRKNGR
jgi:TRAP-type mannitol/chloroaromatic compound transport system permease small subunit